MGVKKKKILFLHHATGIGGAPINMINIIRGLDKNKYDITVLLINDSEVKKLLMNENIKYILLKHTFYNKYYQYFIHSLPGWIKWYEFIRLFYLIICWLLSRYFFSQKVLSKFDYDLIHLNSSVLTDWLPAASKKGKVIMHIQEPISEGYFGLRKKIFTYLIKTYANYIIAISHDNALRIGYPEKTSVVYNFTDFISEPTIDNKKISAENQLKKVIYLGGASEIKGFYTLIDALPFINENINILFAGYYPPSNQTKGVRKYLPQKIRLKTALIKMRNYEKVEELGLVYDVSDYIKQSVVLVSPFSVEHFSRPVIEAFAHKKSAIGTNVEGMKEIIDHNENGLIVEKNNPKALADAINYLCANPDVSMQMGERGFKKAQELFSPDNIKQIEAIYDSLLS